MSLDLNNHTETAPSPIGPVELADTPAIAPTLLDAWRRRGARSGPALEAPAAEGDATSLPGPVRSFPDVEVAYDAAEGVYWQWMRPRGRPCFSQGLIASAKEALDQAQRIALSRSGALRYVVSGSRVPGVFNLGGDLAHFAALIAAGDRAGLRRYAAACIDVQHRRATHMGQSYVSISLVQGDCLGGGFECALSDDVIIAEKGSRFGLPEVLFGLFPGMGAYSFLSRKLGEAQAERMILSGEIYTAEDLHALGLVTRLAEPGAGEAAVQDFIRQEQRSYRARTALTRIRREVSGVTRAELDAVAEAWVDAALTLGEAERRKMLRLAKAQDRRRQQETAVAAAG